MIAHAVALLNWHRRHRFCSNCGARSESREAGHIRRCPACGTEHHPRTDPVVIMLVCDGDRVVLGRQAHWPTGRYSALAGFVEPGESLEEAVAREVREECGARVTDVRYRSSQPWPFPTSLMLGFHARWIAGEPAIGDEELEDVRWFTRDEIAGGGVKLPPPEAIARRLIDEWLGREAPGAPGLLAV
jgi:NAD+ diphosphatase